MYVLYLKDDDANIYYLIDEDCWHKHLNSAMPFFSFEEAKAQKQKLDPEIKKKNGWNQAVKIKKLTAKESREMFEIMENNYIELQKEHCHLIGKLRDVLNSFSI